MDVITCIYMSVLLMVADGFTLRGPSGPVVAPLGSSVVLPCSVDEPLSLDDLEVEWKRIDSDTLVHLYQDGKSRAEAQQQDYQDRAHFFTEEIQHGNFSLRLDNLRAEDEGEYTCTVHSQQESGETVVEIKVVERLLVSGSDETISASVGEDITLSCSVDSPITLEHIEKVSWIKTDEGIVVLLYQKNQTSADSSDEQYRDRVEFFSDEIPKRNFSLRLKSVRTEDKGVYMCEVFAGGLSANTTVVLQRLGLSSLHIAVLIFCFVAGSGAVFLLCCLIYCRSKNIVTCSTIWNLQLSLVFFPNFCLLFAFVFWGLIEGFLYETITCCAFYIMRPAMLISALPFLKYLQDNIKTWIRFFKITIEFAVFTIVLHSVIFTYGWRMHAHDANTALSIISGIFFGFVVLLCLILSGGLFPLYSFLLSLFQLFHLLFSLDLPSPAFLTVAFAQHVLLIYIPYLPLVEGKFKFLCQRWITLLWITTFLHIVLQIYFHLGILQKEKECVEWTCVISFLEVLRMMVVFDNSMPGQKQRHQTETNQQGSKTLHLCHEIMFMFGAVGLVLLSSVALTAELILKARNGERILDLRVTVFTSEGVFALYWLILQMHAFWKSVTTEYIYTQRSLHQKCQLKNTPETEMENLSSQFN